MLCSEKCLREMTLREISLIEMSSIYVRNIFKRLVSSIKKPDDMVSKCTMCSAVHHTSGKNIGFQWGASWPIVWHFKITWHLNGVKWNFCMTMTSLQNLDWLAIFLIRFKLETNPEITGFMFKICLTSSDTEISGHFFNLFSDPFQYETPCTTLRSITIGL